MNSTVDNPNPTPEITHTRWQIVLFVTLAGLSMGGGLLILLASGLADPHALGSLRWQADSPHGWPQVDSANERIRHAAPAGLPNPPFTLSLQATNTGSPHSAWGLWIETTAQPFIVMIDNSNYMSLPDWRQFPHIRHDYTNTITLDMLRDYQAVLRINDEIAWNGTLTPGISWGVILEQHPVLHWQTIRLYTPD